ncbi:MAG: FkbM family methyltransferase [Alphaproteobacteria bacterium]|nr:FkbM family methyltransferase [Alphaproteobacteria bacterium]
MLAKLLDILLKNRERILAYDVSANNGIHSLARAQRFGPRIKIRAFEAQRPLYHMLCGTLALNNIPSVTAHHKAVSDRAGETITITLPDYNLPNNFGSFELIPPRLSDNQSMTPSVSEIVDTIILDEFDEAVNFIKMDIGGMED